MSEHLVPVTQELRTALAATSVLLDAIERRTRKVNDKDAFHDVALQLEGLTVAVLSATSTTSLLAPEPVGARINVASGTELAKRITQSVTYLRGEATSVLNRGGLSQYDRSQTEDAIVYLKTLYELVTGAVVYQATADLKRLRNEDVAALVGAADRLADVAAVALAKDKPEQVMPNF